ncbi:hypothetical protein [Pseudomonas lini]|uniref:Uncharacterized protein n=1 Tax=Pseudomonas lini TaxID=163011 RepID=A0A1H1YKS2_9PSED|nr:hypothetical protein [Pseudomonas lini]KAB0502783.1 hypothetical protein F7R14_19295 [Pseudomonas lini]SDT22050.1 hypothetical protein SAMN04490191_3541 [Pseudomonas lini]
MTNIERFDQLTGRIFAVLYEDFPMTVDLTDEAFTDAIVVDPVDSEEGMDQLMARGEFFSATVLWLIKSGYISFYEDISKTHDMFLGCTLTAKALEALKATPSTLSGDSIGASLQAAAKGGMVEAIKSLTNDALSKGLALATRAAIDLATP